jgi:hypothetical protein
MMLTPLQDDVEIPLFHVAAHGGLGRRPTVGTTAVHFATGQGKVDDRAAGIAPDDFKVGPDQVVDDLRRGHRWAGRAGGTTNHTAFALGVGDRLDAGSVPDEGDVVVDDAVADPVELGRVIFDAGLAHRLVQRHRLSHRADHGAVLRRQLVKPICRPAAARTGHVLRHDGRISRNMLVDVAADGTGVGVIPAARTVADDQFDGLPFIEFLHRGRLGGAPEPGEGQKNRH